MFTLVLNCVFCFGYVFLVFAFVHRICESILCSVSAFDNNICLLSAYYLLILFVEREYLYNTVFTLIVFVFTNLHYTTLALTV
jgi:hypothetical protein